MGQVTIYIDGETEKRMMASVKAEKISKSKWITNVIREKVAKEWPVSVRKLDGAWADFPSIGDLRSGISKDVRREKL